MACTAKAARWPAPQPDTLHYRQQIAPFLLPVEARPYSLTGGRPAAIVDYSSRNTAFASPARRLLKRMASHKTFSQHLIGQASLERPSFFYAYAGMWLHLLVGALLILFFGSFSFVKTLPSLMLGSVSIGILIYSLLTREYALLINVLSYILSMIRTLSPATLGIVFLPVAIIVTIVSGYSLLSKEYRKYSREQCPRSSNDEIPIYITVLIGFAVMLICIYGLSLLR